MFRVRKASLYALVILALGLGGIVLLTPTTFEGTAIDAPAPALRLEAPYRGTVELADLRGDVVLVTFGRPSCAPGCTRQLTVVSEALDRLGDRRSDVRVLFVNLDPDPEPAGLLAFVQDHDLGFTGLGGDSAAIRAVAAAYEAAASEAAGAPVPAPRVYGIDRTGVLRVVWTATDPDVLARDLRVLLRS